MKKIKKKAVKEIAEYQSDFSGEKFPHGLPPAKIVIDFNYGSQYDGARLELELSDGEAGEIVDLLAPRLCEESRKEFRKKILLEEGRVDGAVAARDWREADMLYASTDMFRRILGERGKGWER